LRTGPPGERFCSLGVEKGGIEASPPATAPLPLPLHLGKAGLQSGVQPAAKRPAALP
jgi:hypothetical protein